MRRKEREVLENVKIEAIAAEGKAIAHINGKVLFVPFAIPGDIVNILVTRKKSGYMEGNVLSITTPSPDRKTPFCSHYGTCGGCKWQPLPYPLQLEFKEQQVVDQLTRIGKLELPAISPILGSEKTEFYRNKLEYTFSKKRWIESKDEMVILSDKDVLGLGFHISGYFDKVLDIEKCYLQEEPSNSIRLFIKDFAVKHDYPFFDLREQTGFLRTIVIRTSSTSEVMLIVVFAYEDKEL